MTQAPSPTLLAILDEIAHPGTLRTEHQLRQASGRPPQAVRACLEAAIAAGLVERRGDLYTSTRDGRAVRHSGGGAPLRRDLRQSLWTALRRLRKATVAELVTVAASGEEAAPGHNARTYLAALGRAGYVRALRHRGAGNVKVWVLVRDTGARAPLVSHDGTVRDCNTGEVHPPVEPVKREAGHVGA